MESTFPRQRWEDKTPDDLGFSRDKLAGVETWLRETYPDEKFRVVIARYGYLAAEWNQGVETDEQLGQASASKSYFSCMLGIAVEQGKVPSPDAKVIEYYPEMMDIAEDEGPKPGRYPFDKDRDITFRQLICNTSGYMKPGEEPGKVFHYQTFGMNILTNSIATIYGLYDSKDPDRLLGCGQLIEDYIRDPIQATWRYSSTISNTRHKRKRTSSGTRFALWQQPVTQPGQATSGSTGGTGTVSRSFRRPT